MGLGLGGWRGGLFFQVVFGVESGLSSVHSDTRHWTFHASFIGVAGVRGEDLFSFQPIGKAKVSCFYFFQVSGGGRTKDFFLVFLFS